MLTISMNITADNSTQLSIRFLTCTSHNMIVNL